MEEFETNKLSFANSAYAQIYRADDIKKRCQRAAATCNHFQWNIELDNMWTELAPDLPQKFVKNKDKIAEWYKKINDINKLILTTGNLIYGNGATGFNKVSSTRREQISMQRLYLMRKEIILGELQNELGKGTRWADEDSDGM